MNLKRQLALLAGAAVVVAAAVGIAGAAPSLPFNTPPDNPRIPQTAIDAVRSGHAKVLDTHVPDLHLAVWDGCHFVFKTAHNQAVETPDGTRMSKSDPPEADDPADAVRPPGCVDREPTQAEIDAMQARLNALSTAAANEANRLNGVAGTVPPPPPMQVSPRS